MILVVGWPVFLLLVFIVEKIQEIVVERERRRSGPSPAEKAPR